MLWHLVKQFNALTELLINNVAERFYVAFSHKGFCKNTLHKINRSLRLDCKALFVELNEQSIISNLE